ncbi:hypothetical protein HK102_004997 [Quaeritorhiza haematococci]|nr:hypothetical protein HK102_004997 [Quaeritorhiza haematococci]
MIPASSSNSTPHFFEGLFGRYDTCPNLQESARKRFPKEGFLPFDINDQQRAYVRSLLEQAFVLLCYRGPEEGIPIQQGFVSLTSMPSFAAQNSPLLKRFSIEENLDPSLTTDPPDFGAFPSVSDLVGGSRGHKNVGLYVPKTDTTHLRLPLILWALVPQNVPHWVFFHMVFMKFAMDIKRYGLSVTDDSSSASPLTSTSTTSIISTVSREGPSQLPKTSTIWTAALVTPDPQLTARDDQRASERPPTSTVWTAALVTPDPQSTTRDDQRESQRPPTSTTWTPSLAATHPPHGSISEHTTASPAPHSPPAQKEQRCSLHLEKYPHRRTSSDPATINVHSTGLQLQSSSGPSRTPIVPSVPPEHCSRSSSTSTVSTSLTTLIPSNPSTLSRRTSTNPQHLAAAERDAREREAIVTRLIHLEKDKDILTEKVALLEVENRILKDQLEEMKSRCDALQNRLN